ncbi:unnamed protein product [Alopecurus aequalis]
MESPPPPHPTNRNLTTVPSLPLSPRLSDVRSDDPDGKSAPGKKLAKVSSGEKAFELIVRLDPSGFLILLCLMSMVYAIVASWRVWSLLDQPGEMFWNSSLQLCLLLFIWTITVSERRQMIISQFAYILLLSCAATHFLGPINGMLVMYLSMLYASALLGYSASGYYERYCERLGIKRYELLTCMAEGPSHDEVGASLVCTLISVCSIVCIARIAWLILAPDTGHRSFFNSFDYAIEMWAEICVTFGLWTIYITQFDLRGTILSMDTFAWAAPTFFCGGLLIGVFLFLAIGDAIAIFFFWIAIMALMGFFGYVLALRACFKTINASSCPSTKWAQRSDKVYLAIDLADAKDVMLNMKPDGHFNFSAKGCDEIQYELHLELFGAVNVEQSKVAFSPGGICYLIKKAESNWWPRLFKKKGRPPAYLKVDLDKWQDEDDADTGFGDFGDMVFKMFNKGGDDDE